LSRTPPDRWARRAGGADLPWSVQGRVRYGHDFQGDQGSRQTPLRERLRASPAVWQGQAVRAFLRMKRPRPAIPLVLVADGLPQPQPSLPPPRSRWSPQPPLLPPRQLVLNRPLLGQLQGSCVCVQLLARPRRAPVVAPIRRRQRAPGVASPTCAPRHLALVDRALSVHAPLTTHTQISNTPLNWVTRGKPRTFAPCGYLHIKIGFV
jgi:hypothetical protein